MRIKLTTDVGEHVAYVKPAVAFEEINLDTLPQRQLLIWGTRMFVFKQFQRPQDMTFVEIMPTVVIEGDSNG